VLSSSAPTATASRIVRCGGCAARFRLADRRRASAPAVATRHGADGDVWTAGACSREAQRTPDVLHADARRRGRTAGNSTSGTRRPARDRALRVLAPAGLWGLLYWYATCRYTAAGARPVRGDRAPRGAASATIVAPVRDGARRIRDPGLASTGRTRRTECAPRHAPAYVFRTRFTARPGPLGYMDAVYLEPGAGPTRRSTCRTGSTTSGAKRRRTVSISGGPPHHRRAVRLYRRANPADFVDGGDAARHEILTLYPTPLRRSCGHLAAAAARRLLDPAARRTWGARRCSRLLRAGNTAARDYWLFDVDPFPSIGDVFYLASTRWCSRRADVVRARPSGAVGAARPRHGHPAARLRRLLLVLRDRAHGRLASRH